MELGGQPSQLRQDLVDQTDLRGKVVLVDVESQMAADKALGRVSGTGRHGIKGGRTKATDNQNGGFFVSHHERQKQLPRGHKRRGDGEIIKGV